MEWIKVSEQLPKEEQGCLGLWQIRDDDGRKSFKYFLTHWYGENWAHVRWDGGLPFTHWMPLPAPPEEE